MGLLILRLSIPTVISNLSSKQSLHFVQVCAASTLALAMRAMLGFFMSILAFTTKMFELMFAKIFYLFNIFDIL